MRFRSPQHSLWRTLLGALALCTTLALAPSAQAATAVTSCGETITSPGAYELTHNLDCSGGNGVSVQSSDVTLSLNGFTIDHTDVGVYSYGLDNVTVMGPGTIANAHNYAILMQSQTNSGVDGVTMFNSFVGMFLNYSTGGTNFVRNVDSRGSYYNILIQFSTAEVSNNVCSAGTYGILDWYSQGGNFHGNTCNDNSADGIHAESATNAIFHDNTATGNGSYDGFDSLEDCGTNQWYGNLFGTFSPACANNAPGAGAGGPTGPVCTITGTAGNDRLRGTSGNDVICGLGGDDVLDGRGGNDEVYGDDGNDTVIGKGGNDKLVGGAGIDLLLPGSGNDTADGGDGTRDRVLFSDITGGGVHVLLASGSVTPEGGSNVGSDTLSNIEQVFGSQQSDVLIAQIAGVASTLKGGAGDDQLDVGDGDGLDTVVGNQGADTCNTDAGDQARDC
jgi:parallel beta-helix repeat protein